MSTKRSGEGVGGRSQGVSSLTPRTWQASRGRPQVTGRSAGLAEALPPRCRWLATGVPALTAPACGVPGAPPALSPVRPPPLRAGAAAWAVAAPQRRAHVARPPALESGSVGPTSDSPASVGQRLSRGPGGVRPRSPPVSEVQSGARARLPRDMGGPAGAPGSEAPSLLLSRRRLGPGLPGSCRPGWRPEGERVRGRPASPEGLPPGHRGRTVGQVSPQLVPGLRPGVQ